MIPPGPVSFFFTANKLQVHSKLYNKCDALEPYIKVKLIKFILSFHLTANKIPNEILGC